MFAQFFGHYLLNKGIITNQQLQEAMDKQRETRVKLGVLAINQNVMTAAQVDEVHQAQMQKDKRFGEIAVELGYVTEEQIEQLLSSQKSAHLLLGQALLDQEILSYDSFSAALSNFKQENSLSDEEFTSIMNGDIDTLIHSVFVKDQLPEGITEYISLFAKNIIRFVDTDIRMEFISHFDKHSYPWSVSQDIISETGEVSKRVAMAGNEQDFIRFASRYAQEEMTEADEMMQASVGEFLNLHNGIYLVNVSNNKSIELELKPQVINEDSQYESNNYRAFIRIIGSDFCIDLFVPELTGLLN